MQFKLPERLHTQIITNIKGKHEANLAARQNPTFPSFGSTYSCMPFLKKKEKVLGKRSGLVDSVMQEEDQSASVHLVDSSGKKSRVTEAEKDEEEKKNAEGQDEEATSHGAAGTLTGVEERACQEP